MAERTVAEQGMAERRSTVRPPTSTVPNLRREKALAAEGARWVIGCDEVGRGAIAGPVAVGLCVVDLSRRVPRGLKDSKLLPEKRRVELEPQVGRWAVYSAVGMATNEEIDAYGLTVALGLAGARAVIGLLEQDFPCAEAVVLLDGKHDYLTAGLTRAGIDERPRVTTRIKADMTCASVSGASVLAKVKRDNLMIGHHDDFPHYGWVSNKGYGSSAHWAAIDEFGASDLHRHTWLRTPSLFDLEDDPAGRPGDTLSDPEDADDDARFGEDAAGDELEGRLEDDVEDASAAVPGDPGLAPAAAAASVPLAAG